MSRIISEFGLWLYPTIALVIFLAAFAAIIARNLQPSRRAAQQRTAALPLEDAPIESSTSSPSLTEGELPSEVSPKRAMSPRPARLETR